MKDLSKILEELPKDSLLIMCGLPATGKSTVTKKMAEIKGYEILSSDMLRPLILKGEDIFDKKVASNMDKRLLVYEVMFKKAEDMLREGKGVILDATFVKQDLRKRAAAISYSLKKPFIIVEVVCDKEIALERIRKRREKDEYESNAISEDAYFNNLRIFEPVDIEDILNSFPLELYYIILDTSSGIEVKGYEYRGAKKKD